MRPRCLKRGRAEELDEPTEKKSRPKLVSSDETSTKLPRQASGGLGTRLTRASSALSLQLERADSFADLRTDESVAAEAIEWEGALLSPLAGGTKGSGVSGAVSVSLIRTRSQGLREVGSVRKSDDVDFESSEESTTPPASASSAASTPGDDTAPSSETNGSVFSVLTFKTDKATPTSKHAPPPPPRLSTVLSGV